MVDADILGSVIEKFISPDINLSPHPIFKDAEKTMLKHPGLDNHNMGTIFEELIENSTKRITKKQENTGLPRAMLLNLWLTLCLFRLPIK